MIKFTEKSIINNKLQVYKIIIKIINYKFIIFKFTEKSFVNHSNY